jgi:hypothetical protein
MTFSELIEEYLELKAAGPNESDGYTDKRYYERLSLLKEGMDLLAPGEVEIVPDPENMLHREVLTVKLKSS